MLDPRLTPVAHDRALRERETPLFQLRNQLPLTKRGIHQTARGEDHDEQQKSGQPPTPSAPRWFYGDLGTHRVISLR